MVPRIIVKDLLKRNEDGVTPGSRVAQDGMLGAPVTFPGRLYKSTRRERLIVYGPARTPAERSTRFQSNRASASHENTVAAMNPGASTLRRRHPVRRPHDAAFRNILAQKVHMALQFS
jgi:hypothetical protein